MLKKLAATGIVTVAAAGAMMVAAPAFADTDTTNGTGSILGGNQVDVPITIPITVACNGIGLLGSGAAHCGGAAG
jgi:hypothetical protein